MDKENAIHTHTHIYAYHAAIKKEALPFATMWMNLEGMLSEISQTAEKDNYCMVLHVESQKKKKKT